MYMRISWVHTEPGQSARYLEEFRRLRLPDAIRSVQVAQGHDNPDSIFIVSLWDSIEAIRAWESSTAYLEDFNPRLKPFIQGNYSVSVCEVVHSRGGLPSGVRV
ncbi:MAG TPA: antibiotic biosynthesis monooxygenase [Ramlibacter sp.]|nr:antibiotic biosynthesis monooxygenase [Ramlibacter sp.]